MWSKCMRVWPSLIRYGFSTTKASAVRIIEGLLLYYVQAPLTGLVQHLSLEVKLKSYTGQDIPLLDRVSLRQLAENIGIWGSLPILI